MYVVDGSSFNEVYEQMISLLEEPMYTRKVSPRGIKVVELDAPISYTVTEPWSCWLTLRGRKLNPFFAAAEVFWILAGNGKVKWISKFNKKMEQFADPGQENFSAAYGERIFRWPYGYAEFFNKDTREHSIGRPTHIDQFNLAFKRLKEDPYTRQAFITIAHPILDNKKVRDIACNRELLFTLRDEKLSCTITQRSNDVILGACHNSLHFYHVMSMMAGELGVSIGTRTQVINNLHFYEQTFYSGLEKFKGEFVEFDQTFCNQTFTRNQFLEAYGWVDRLIFTQSNYDFDVIENLLKGDHYYLSQLTALPLLYNLYLKGTNFKDIIRFAELKLNPLFVFLIKDFWKDKVF